MLRLLFSGRARLLLLMLPASFAGALLLAPGCPSDERQLNGKLSPQSIKAIP